MLQQPSASSHMKPNARSTATTTGARVANDAVELELWTFGRERKDGGVDPTTTCARAGTDSGGGSQRMYSSIGCDVEFDHLTLRSQAASGSSPQSDNESRRRRLVERILAPQV